MYWATEMGQVVWLSRLIDLGADAQTPRCKWGDTPLMSASARNDRQCLQLLLSYLPTNALNVQRTRDGSSPAHVAVHSSDCRGSLEELWLGGADLHLLDKDGMTPLQLARKLGKKQCVEFLLSIRVRNLHSVRHMNAQKFFALFPFQQDVQGASLVVSTIHEFI